MKSYFYLPLSAAIFLVGGCSQKSSVSEAERAQFQNELKDEAKRGASSMKGLSEATVKGGQIEIGDAQGRPLWRVAAKELKSQGETRNGVPKSAVLTTASATLFRAGKPESSFQADTINLFNSPKGVRLQMTGKVIAVSKSMLGAPIEVRAPRADVDVTKRTLAASGGVSAKRGDITLQTPELTGQTSLQTLGCKTATILSRGTTVRGQNALFNWKTNRLSAQKVTATRDKLTMSGQKLEADTAAQRGVLTGQVQAKSPRGSASGPRLEFNWKNDRIFVPNALFQGQDARVQTAALTTDSKLRVTNAQNVRIERDGAVLTVRSARGLENLSSLSGSGVTFSRGALRIEAGSAQTNNWSKDSGSIQASGGVFARTNQGTLRARSATWSGNAENGSVSASGGVQINAQGGTLRGSRGQSDAKFQNAVLTGSVNGNLRDGTRIRAGQLEKHGETYVASRGASATLPDGTLVTAGRVEGSGQNAVATGGATATLRDGTHLRANRVEKRGTKVVATNGATATLRANGSLGRVTVTAARVEGDTSATRVVASGGVVLRAQNGTVVRAPHAVYERGTGKITATGGVSIVDPVRHFSQTGESLVADLNLKQVTVESPTNVHGQGQTNTLTGKGLF
ncbi:LPS-assembly protein LptD [Abditibacteriota bacterium]|nr:LPS-assembly protein LptD [Abditibacteriota bacterium]